MRLVDAGSVDGARRAFPLLLHGSPWRVTTPCSARSGLLCDSPGAPHARGLRAPPPKSPDSVSRCVPPSEHQADSPQWRRSSPPSSLLQVREVKGVARADTWLLRSSAVRAVQIPDRCVMQVSSEPASPSHRFPSFPQGQTFSLSGPVH